MKLFRASALGDLWATPTWAVGPGFHMSRRWRFGRSFFGEIWIGVGSAL